MPPVSGLHHITAIAGPAQENLDFYTGVLGMRLVKRTINQDDPTTYHLFYADADGHPGSSLTFFAWTHSAPPRLGHGLGVEISLEVPVGSLPYWAARLAQHKVKVSESDKRFGDTNLPLTDLHGLKLSLVESAQPAQRPFTPWDRSPVPAQHQIRGLYGARLWEQNAERTSLFLTKVLGLQAMGTENEWSRYGSAGMAGIVDIRQSPERRRGVWGIGTPHHIAWRIGDDEQQLAMRDQLEKAGSRLTNVIDRVWFKSVYFREPGGVLFEIATDGPGFTKDEPPEHLGERLALPPWLESQRDQIEGGLPPLT